MSSRLKQYRLVEIGGNDFASLAIAHKASADEFSGLLAEKIRAMLQDGQLTVENGIIIPAKSNEVL
jgi:hypothetical protein